MKQVKIGIIGIGRMGQIHLDNLMQKFSEVEVVAISDINEQARQWANKYSMSKFYSNYKDLISDQEVNTVVICSPTNQHAENIIAAAQAGKDVFCEKPMDLSIKTAMRVLQIVEKTLVYPAYHGGTSPQALPREPRGVQLGFPAVGQGCLWDCRLS